MAKITCKQVLLYCRVFIIFGLNALFVLLTLARATREDSWSWYLAFIPLFIFDAISVVYWVLYLISYIVVKTSEDGVTVWSGTNSVIFPGQSFSLLYLLAYSVGIPIKISGEILLLLHLQEPTSIRVFIPAVLFMLLFLEVGTVAVCEAVTPLVRVWRHSYS